LRLRGGGDFFIDPREGIRGSGDKSPGSLASYFLMHTVQTSIYSALFISHNRFALNQKNNVSQFFVPLQKKDMLTKTTVIKTITRFPDNFSIDELVDKMILLEKIEKGIQDADNGRVISEDELEKRMEEWSK